MRYRYVKDADGLWLMFDELTKTVVAEGLTEKELEVLKIGVGYGMSIMK